MIMHEMLAKYNIPFLSIVEDDEYFSVLVANKFTANRVRTACIKHGHFIKMEKTHLGGYEIIGKPNLEE